MTPLRVFLGDLTHDTILLVSDTIPINIGFIAAYLQKRFPDQVEISLFKYPGQMIEAIRNRPPDVVGLSNYSWNSNLSEFVAGRAKAANPKAVTVQGGTNFPHAVEQQSGYLTNRPFTDIHVVLEGEGAFANVVARVLECLPDFAAVFRQPIDGTVFLAKQHDGSGTPPLIVGAPVPRLRDLDEIPSPYLTGIMEPFFDGRLTPFLETNRGCPFKCAFCHTGADYFQKIHMFSTERVINEIEYLAPRMQEMGIVNLHLADTNFGMYPRDREIAQALHDANQRYDWPQQIMSTTGKNNKERVIEITSLLGNVFSVNMSVQSMDDTVLKNINRSNIKLDHYTTVNQHLKNSGRSTCAELIIGLPGETKESFLKGIEEVIEAGVSSTTIYTLMLLYGTEFKDPSYREKFGIKGKYRIVPLNFGEYDGERVMDYEEVAVETNSMSFQEYIYIRGFALLVESLLNGRPFDEIFRFAEGHGITRTAFLRLVYDGLADAPKKIRDLIEAFLEETQSELWDSDTDMVRHYRMDDNYRRLKDGEVGGNLIYKYKSSNILHAVDDWIIYLSATLKSELAARGVTDEIGEGGPLDQIADFCHNKTAGLLDQKADVSHIDASYGFDILGWMKSEDPTPLSSWTLEAPVTYRFAFSQRQLHVRDDLFRRYGADVNALSKIVTRISNLESLFREVTVSGTTVDLYDTGSDRFTRYALSN